MLLNFGHTIGHAVEKCSDFSYTHGEAVALGMFLSTKIAYRTGTCDEKTLASVKKALDAHNLPTKLELPVKDVADAMIYDKKRVGNDMIFVLPEKIGKCVLKKIPVADILPLLELAAE